MGGNVRIRYNESAPSNAEIAQAQGIAGATGEPVELFGGIDGTIGRPPRRGVHSGRDRRDTG